MENKRKVTRTEYFYESGEKQTETYTTIYDFRLLYHRDDGPAYISWHKNGVINIKDYCFEGKRHRVDGPAYIMYDWKGKKTDEAFFISGFEKDIKSFMALTGIDLQICKGCGRSYKRD